MQTINVTKTTYSVSHCRCLLLRLGYILLLIYPVFVCANKPEHIFILHSYSQEYPWTSAQHKGFVSRYTAASKHQSLISTEYLDSKRIAYNGEYATFFLTYLQSKYKNYQPEIIYVTDDNALSFALDHIDQIFPQAKVIFSGVNDYSVINRLDKTRSTGVFEKKEIAPNIELLRLIDPELSEILVVGDGSNT